MQTFDNCYKKELIHKPKDNIHMFHYYINGYFFLQTIFFINEIILT